MARLHILNRGGVDNVYTVVVHAVTPAGNNSAGQAWKDVVAAALKPRTAMTIGLGPGQIEPYEAAQVARGEVLEAWLEFTDNPAWTNAQRNAALDADAAAKISTLQAQIAARLKFYGATRA